MDDFLEKLKKVVCIVLYGPAISQSDCRKASPYQLPLITQNKVVTQDPLDIFAWNQETQNESKIKYLFVSSEKRSARNCFKREQRPSSQWQGS